MAAPVRSEVLDDDDDDGERRAAKKCGTLYATERTPPATTPQSYYGRSASECRKTPWMLCESFTAPHSTPTSSSDCRRHLPWPLFPAGAATGALLGDRRAALALGPDPLRVLLAVLRVVVVRPLLDFPFKVWGQVPRRLGRRPNPLRLRDLALLVLQFFELRLYSRGHRNAGAEASAAASKGMVAPVRMPIHKSIFANDPASGPRAGPASASGAQSERPFLPFLETPPLPARAVAGAQRALFPSTALRWALRASRSASGAWSEPWPRSRAHDAAARRRRLPVRTHTTPPSARTRCPLAADPGCNLPGQRSFQARWQMVAKPARRRSPRRHQQRRRRRSSSHSASRAVRLPHAAPIDPVHCTSGATMCTCSSMPMPRVPCADADRVECTAAGRARLGPSRPDGAARRPQADGSWPMPAVSWPFGLGHSSARVAAG